MEHYDPNRTRQQVSILYSANDWYNNSLRSDWINFSDAIMQQIEGEHVLVLSNPTITIIAKINSGRIGFDVFCSQKHNDIKEKILKRLNDCIISKDHPRKKIGF